MRHMTLSLRRGVGNILKYEKIRFGLVGLVNTVVDFGVLSVLSLLVGVPVFMANIISTSCALVVSFLLNKKAVFGNRSEVSSRQVISFLLVTLSGLWVLQTLVMMVVWWVIYSIIGEFQLALSLIVGKVIATAVTLVWNYLWYSRVVFRKDKK